MDNNYNTVCVDAEQIAREWHISKSSAYNVIKNMNKRLLEINPDALVLPGKVNKLWYDSVCMRNILFPIPSKKNKPKPIGNNA